jgi:hypothetical protein
VDRAEVAFGAAVRRSIVVGEVDVRHPAVAGTSEDRLLTLERHVVAEVVPQAQGEYR